MVLLAASICTKDGKALLSRQFVEMTKARIEGLIATFPKLVGEGKQHTFVETESVRYVYQQIEQLYVLLITTKASNILEDLETLRLFARLIPEYACGTDEVDILNNAFSLIFAFDEIVALGYREDVTIAQIRTFTEMDSHEERVFRAMQESKERETKELMKQRARDLQLAKQEAAKRGQSGFGSAGLRSFKPSSTGFGSDTAKPNDPRVVHMRDQFGADNDMASSKKAAANLSVKRSGMQLGARGGSGGVDQFVTRLKAEGEVVGDDLAKMMETTNISVPSQTRMGVKQAVDAVEKEDLHIRIEEKMSARVSRDGGLEQFELQGTMHALAATPICTEARIRVDAIEALRPSNERQPAAQMQTHPNLDKKAFASNGWLQIKSGGKPFPVGQEVGVLRWRMVTQEESVLPITVNCWPNPIRGGFEVNIEYELLHTALELQNATLTIPLPTGAKPPAVGNCDGDFEVNARKTQLTWLLPPIDPSNSSGSIEFTISTDSHSSADQFFPLQLNLSADKSFCGIRVVETMDPQGKPVPYSSETALFTEKFEVV